MYVTQHLQTFSDCHEAQSNTNVTWQKTTWTHELDHIKTGNRHLPKIKAYIRHLLMSNKNYVINTDMTIGIVISL